MGIDELKSKNINLQLYIEDDASANKQTVTAYHYLVDVKKVDVIIAGTWWINDVISLSKRDNIPILSCETMFNDDAVLSSNYYLLGGDLRDWINTYSDLVKEKDFKRAAVIHFISGFGFTIKREVQNLFSGNGKKFLGSIEYTDPNVEDVNTIVLKLKQIKPEVVYIDGQPNGLAKILKKMKEMKIENITVFTNSIAEDMLKQNLISRESLPKLYFTKRASYSTEFINKFQSKYGIEPFLNADLGYYSTQIIAESLITTAKQGSFDIKNNLN